MGVARINVGNVQNDGTVVDRDDSSSVWNDVATIVDGVQNSPEYMRNDPIQSNERQPSQPSQQTNTNFKGTSMTYLAANTQPSFDTGASRIEKDSQRTKSVPQSISILQNRLGISAQAIAEARAHALSGQIQEIPVGHVQYLKCGHITHSCIPV